MCSAALPENVSVPAGPLALLMRNGAGLGAGGEQREGRAALVVRSAAPPAPATLPPHAPPPPSRRSGFHSLKQISLPAPSHSIQTECTTHRPPHTTHGRRAQSGGGGPPAGPPPRPVPPRASLSFSTLPPSAATPPRFMWGRRRAAALGTAALTGAPHHTHPACLFSCLPPPQASMNEIFLSLPVPSPSHAPWAAPSPPPVLHS